MNSRQRVIAALEHKKPDRVPLMEIWIDDAVVQAILPGSSSNEVAVHLGMDVVSVPTMVYEEGDVEWIVKDGPRRVFRDKWGAVQRLTQEAAAVVSLPPRIETPADLASYVPPDPAASPVIGRIRALRQRYGPQMAVAVIGEAALAPAEYLRGGLENICLDFALRPAFAKDLMQIGMEYYCELYRLAIAAGADVVLLGDDYASKTATIMSPAHFQEIILPALAEVVGAVKTAGGYCIKHSDGNIWAILDSIVETGVDAVGPLEPAAGMDLADVWQKYDGKLSVMGNVDVDLLSRGSHQDVVAATKDLLARVSVGGGHIMASGNSIASSVKPENFIAMIQTTRQFGAYPIDVESLA